MSSPSRNFEGGIDYALLKRHYDMDDALTIRDPATGIVVLNGIPFTAIPTFYVIGYCAALTDPTVIDVLRGWTPFAHGQAAPPAYLAAILAALGITWTAEVPAFEAKDIEFYATEDCFIRFEDSIRVEHFIPRETYRRFHRRHLMFWVVRDTQDGVLRFDVEG